MKLSDKAEKYLEILIEYSQNLYKTSIAKLPEGTKLAIRDDRNEIHVNDLVIMAFAEILGMDILHGKVSVYEMSYILMYLSELLFGVDNTYREISVEERIFKPLIENMDDETVGFLINGNNLNKKEEVI